MLQSAFRFSTCICLGNCVITFENVFEKQSQKSSNRGYNISKVGHWMQFQMSDPIAYWTCIFKSEMNGYGSP